MSAFDSNGTGLASSFTWRTSTFGSKLSITACMSQSTKIRMYLFHYLSSVIYMLSDLSGSLFLLTCSPQPKKSFIETTRLSLMRACTCSMSINASDKVLIFRYYSRSLFFHTPSSLKEFALPDVKPLPSVLTYWAGLRRKGTIDYGRRCRHCRWLRHGPTVTRNNTTPCCNSHTGTWSQPEFESFASISLPPFVLVR